jgi:hypothetical protein
MNREVALLRLDLRRVDLREFLPYVGALAVLAVILYIIPIAVELFSDLLRDWIVRMYSADPLLFIVASILIFAFIAAGAIWIGYQKYRVQQPENAGLHGSEGAYHPFFAVV